MTANDTQAPERVWLDKRGKSLVTEEPRWACDVEYIRADLSAAREAAAWIAGRDAAVADYIEWDELECLPSVDLVSNSIRALTPPADPAAALDRLIAERVREARAYAREAIIHASNNLSTHLEQYHDYEEETPERRNLRGIMHHLEGTLMGMDDAEVDAARGIKEGR